jgi:hypothetical protein
VALTLEENGWNYTIGLEPASYHANTGLNMDNNDPLHQIHDRISKKKKIGDIVYNVLYAIPFVLLGAAFFFIYKVIQAHMAGRL